MMLEQQLELICNEHSNYYKLECLNECGEVRDNTQYEIPLLLHMGVYEDLFIKIVGKELPS